MRYPVVTPAQLRLLLRALRKARGLSQAQVGAMLGVTQQRMAQIEARPASATFDTVLRLIALLKGRLYVDESTDVSENTSGKATVSRRRSEASNEDW